MLCVSSWIVALILTNWHPHSLRALDFGWRPPCFMRSCDISGICLHLWPEHYSSSWSVHPTITPHLHSGSPSLFLQQSGHSYLIIITFQCSCCKSWLDNCVSWCLVHSWHTASCHLLLNPNPYPLLVTSWGCGQVGTVLFGILPKD